MCSINLDPLVASLKEIRGAWRIGAQSAFGWVLLSPPLPSPHLGGVFSPIYLGPGSLVWGLIHPLHFPHILEGISLPLVSRRRVYATKG